MEWNSLQARALSREEAEAARLLQGKVIEARTYGPQSHLLASAQRGRHISCSELSWQRPLGLPAHDRQGISDLCSQGCRARPHIQTDQQVQATSSWPLPSRLGCCQQAVLELPLRLPSLAVRVLWLRNLSALLPCTCQTS